MPTYSPNLAFNLPNDGEYSGTWGQITNNNIGTLIEQAISGYTTQIITDGADTVITIPLGATGVARNMYIEGTGALSAARNLIVPANKKLYFFYNNTTGNQPVTVKVSGQTGVSIPMGGKAALVCNGSDIVVAANFFANVDINGGTIDSTPIGATTPAAGSFTNVSVTSATIPVNGLYLPAANTVAIATLSIQRWNVNGVGLHTLAAPSGAGPTIVIPAQAVNITNTIQLPTAGSMINFARSVDAALSGFIGSRIGTSSFSLYNSGGVTAEMEVDSSAIRMYTNGVQRLNISSGGVITVSAPTLAANPAIAATAISGSNVMTLDASASNTAAIKFTLGAASNFLIETNTGASTGAGAAVLTNNKPTAGSSAIFHWIKVNINGTTGLIPVWSA